MAEKEKISDSMLKKFYKLRTFRTNIADQSTGKEFHSCGSGWTAILNSRAGEKGPSSTKPQENYLPSSSSSSKDPIDSTRASGFDRQKIKNAVKHSNIEIQNKSEQERCNAETMKIVHDVLEHVDLDRPPRIPPPEKLHLFYLLRMEIQHDRIEPVLKYSEKLFYILIENYREADEKCVTKGLVMELFRDICANPRMVPFWHNSLGLLLHIVFTGQRSKDPVVPNAARQTYDGLVRYVDVNALLNCLISLIYTVTEMDLVRAIAMLKKLIKSRSGDMYEHHMTTIMYALRHVIKVNKGESTMATCLRKTAISCMASLHFWVGQGKFQRVRHLIPDNEMEKFLECLKDSSVKRFSNNA